jgi:DNA-binding response OmpR family regulator
MARVLLIGGNRNSANLINLYLAGAGHEVREAFPDRDPAWSLDLYQPQVIILEAALQDKACLELINRSRQMEPVPPIVLIATAGKEEECRMLLRAGARDLVLKTPFYQNKLVALVHRYTQPRPANPWLTDRSGVQPSLFEGLERRSPRAVTGNMGV